MKAYLMYRDRDFDLETKLPPDEELVQDLELNTLLNAMALGDQFLFSACKSAVLCSLYDVDTILYRQTILQDCMQNPDVIREIYAIALEAVESERKNFLGIFSKYPDMILGRSIRVLEMFVKIFKKLKDVAGNNADRFVSVGFTAFFAMISRELSDEYLDQIQNHLHELKFKNGVLISAWLGQGNKGSNYILRKSEEKRPSFFQKLFFRDPSAFSIYISDRDDSGFRALNEIKNRGINLAANALAQSNDHILSFFEMLKAELAFYIGCLNLNEQVELIGECLSFPRPGSAGEHHQSFTGLYDICLALTLKHNVIGNDLAVTDQNLFVVTGANQGGKSTFLRSIGLAQLMMQSGMFVPAACFKANVCDRLFTHYRREEDCAMNSGKLEDELIRMRMIADHLTANSMVLFNESFAATNEREGSEIARQIVCALAEKGIKVFFVTHLFDFAHSLYVKNMTNAVFLRADRQSDGKRTFKITLGEPLQTSFGEDLYRKIFKNEGFQNSL